MIDVVLLLLFIALPVAIWWLSRSLTWTAIALMVGFGIAGNLVQSLIALGMAWNVRGLQWASVAVLLLVVVLAMLRRRRGVTGSLRRQLLVIGLPMLVLGGFLIAMRLLASGNPGPLSAVGYLFNHPLAEDNAKWLNLTAQLADGRDLAFNGYAGGPLLLLMAMVASLISVLSLVLLGGVNEVAVAANTVVGTQFLLIALLPVALAPFAERAVTLRGSRISVPAPAVWVGMLVLAVGSAVITSFGHLSLQFVLIVLALWATAFLLEVPGRARLLMTLVIVTTVSVWLPLNVLGVVLLFVTLVWVLRRRDLLGIGLWALVAISSFDAVASSTLFFLGINIGGAAETSGATSSDMGGSAADAVGTATSLFTAPGGVEQIQPAVLVLALASVLFAVWLRASSSLESGWRQVTPFLPIATLGAYVVLVQVGDAIITGSAPHYGGHKLAFAAVMTGLAATLPMAISGLDSGGSRMTVLRWFAVGGVVVLLTVDTMLPRAISALSPKLWPAVNSAAPQAWSAAEVRATGNQPLASVPVACLTAPPESEFPTALPRGQQTYSCTRLLGGLTGTEPVTSGLALWLQTEWMSNQSTWPTAYPILAEGAEALRGRTVILTNGRDEVVGLSTFGALLDRYRPAGTAP